MPDENDLLRQMAVDIAIIRTKLEENEKLQLAKRVAILEKYLYIAFGGSMLINFALGVYVAIKK